MIARKLEICCYSVESALLAAKCGADRIELCQNYTEGGTTPSFGSIRTALAHLQIPLNVMVRPRGGDFLYSSIEFEIMKQEVQQLKTMGANGVVVGFLQADGQIDLKRTQEMIDLAGDMEVTFHRAFDMCRDPMLALEQLIELGVTRILTSGAKVNVVEGMNMLTQLIEKADQRIIVMPGCGLTPDNLSELLHRTQAMEVHSASKTFISSRMTYVNPDVSMGRVTEVEEYQTISVDEDRIRAMVDILAQHTAS